MGATAGFCLGCRYRRIHHLCDGGSMTGARIVTRAATPEEEAAREAVERALANASAPGGSMVHPAASNSSAADSEASQWPDPLDGEAFHGIAGEFVRMIEP